MKPSRRLFLGGLAATAASLTMRRGLALPPTQLATWEPVSQTGTYTPRKVLEVYLRGGASFFSSFWRDADLGGPDGTQDTTLTSAQWSEITGGSAPSAQTWGGGTIGRAAAPLFDHPPGKSSLADRMRVVRVQHKLLPHEAAIPYATTGSTLGRVHQSGLGAAIWRRAAEEPSAPAAVRSLIFQTGSLAADDLAGNYAASYGMHGADLRPPILKLGDSAFYAALERDGVRTDKKEDMMKLYRNRYEDMLRHTNPLTSTSTEARSQGWASYRAALDTMQAYHDDLYALLGEVYSGTTTYADLLFPGSALSPTYADNFTRRGIDAAISLLRNDDHLRHIAVIDSGVHHHYDTHVPPATVPAATGDEAAAIIQNGNIWNVCDALAQRRSDILNGDITVLIHTEFGRIQSNGDSGTEHHTRGYANVVISDVISSPGFAGLTHGDHDEAAAFDAGSGIGPGLTPTDVHAAVAQLAGIDPWQADMFLYDSDLATLGTGDDPAEILLGVT